MSIATNEPPLTRREFYEAVLLSLATKSDLAVLESRLVKWMVGQMIAAIVAASSVALLVQKLVV